MEEGRKGWGRWGRGGGIKNRCLPPGLTPMKGSFFFNGGSFFWCVDPIFLMVDPIWLTRRFCTTQKRHNICIKSSSKKRSQKTNQQKRGIRSTNPRVIFWIIFGDQFLDPAFGGPSSPRPLPIFPIPPSPLPSPTPIPHPRLPPRPLPHPSPPSTPSIIPLRHRI